MPRFCSRKRRRGYQLIHVTETKRGRHWTSRRKLTNDLEAQWAALNRLCVDRGSQIRLARLIDRLNSHHHGVQESALAELELATLLIRVGMSVRFLPESQARTADLECVLQDERLFVEVTAMVGSAEPARAADHLPVELKDDEEEQEGGPGAVLTSRILARIMQKAKQLSDYCAPVVLAVSVPRVQQLEQRVRWRGAVELDLKQLAGLVSVALPRVRHLSTVLLSLWDVEPLPARSGVRLKNVYLVERSRQQAAYPRVRLLIANPCAVFPLSEEQQEALKQLL